MEDNKKQLQQLAFLADAYLPEWKYLPDSGEPAAALLRACGGLLFNTGARIDRLLEKHEIEFLNCLEPEQKEAQASDCWISFRVPPGTGNYLLEKGARLYTAVNGVMAVFSVRHSLCISGVSLRAFYLSSVRQQKLIRIPLPAEGVEQMDFTLFDFQGEGVWKNEVSFFHPDLFSSRNAFELHLWMEAEDTDRRQLLFALADSGQVQWEWNGSGEAVKLPAPRIQENSLCFHMPPGQGERLTVRGLPGSRLPEGKVYGVRFSSARPPQPAERVVSGTGTENPEDFLPFGTEPGPHLECLIASDEIFRQRGAMVTLRFTLSIQESICDLPLPEEEMEYRYVMRRTRIQPKLIRHHVYTDEIRMEYFDGERWDMLPCSGITEQFHAEGGKEEEKQICFMCPENFSPCTVDGEERFWIRFRLLRAENSGWLPCVYHAPKIRSLRLSCQYESTRPPKKIQIGRISNGQTLPANELQKGIPLFGRICGEYDAWYWGLDGKPGSPLRLFLKWDQGMGDSYAFSYSREDGSFAPAEVRDETEGFAHSGGVSLTIPKDFSAAELFEEKLWWIRVEKTGPYLREQKLPRLRGFYINSVSAKAEDAEVSASIQIGERFHFIGKSLPASVYSITPSYGGGPPESRREAVLRTQSELRCQSRAITAKDMEQFICGAFRDIDKVKCLIEKHTRIVRIAVLTRDFESLSFESRKAQMERLITEHSILDLQGFRCCLQAPEFLSIRVTAWLRGNGSENPLELEMEVVKAFRRFLHPVTGGFDGKGWPIGSLPNMDQLRACLQMINREIRIEELLATCYFSEDGTERELDFFRQKPFVLPLSGRHSIQVIL